MRKLSFMSNLSIESLFRDDATPPAQDEELVGLSASELRQMAYDRAREEIMDLEDQRRRMLERHREELRPLEARIATNKRLIRDIVEE